MSNIGKLAVVPTSETSGWTNRANTLLGQQRKSACLPVLCLFILFIYHVHKHQIHLAKNALQCCTLVNDIIKD